MSFKKKSIDKFAIRQQIRLLSIIIPVYNEMPNLLKNLNRIIDFEVNCPNEIIIVESNSKDGSREVVQSLNKNNKVKIIYQDKPLGKGHAIIEGLGHANGDVISIFDSDGEYEISDLNFLIDPIQNGETSFILGTRYSSERKFFRVFRNQKALSLTMNLGHQFFRLYFYLLFGKNFMDPFTMHKIFRSEIFKGVKLSSKRFEIDWELLGLGIRLGSLPKEVPVRYESRSFREGKKISFFRDPLRWIVYALYFKIRKL